VLWEIYHQSAEFAHYAGDPLLLTVEAKSKEEAERNASKLISFEKAPSGVWAVRRKDATANVG